MKKKGFTLIEIMITIAIIAVLVTVSISVFSNLQKNNRDQIRIRDLQGIKQALELYRSDLGDYPASSTDLTDKNYLTNWPVDPISTQSYRYAKFPLGVGFVVCAKKEGNITTPPPSQCTMDCKTGIQCDIGFQSD